MLLSGRHAFLPDAVTLLYRVKERPLTNPIPLLLQSEAQVEEVAREIPESVRMLAKAYWPGGLTLVLPKAAKVPPIVTAGGDSVAVRVPDHPFVLALIRETGAPIAATSANLSGRPSPITAKEVLRDLDGRISLIIDGGRCRGGTPSTVLDLTVDPPRVLREGAVLLDALRRIVPQIEVPRGTSIRGHFSPGGKQETRLLSFPCPYMSF